MKNLYSSFNFSKIKLSIETNLILFVILTFLISRFITYFYLKISIDPYWIYGVWQHINPKYLEESLFSSLLYFHAQPPFWNFILGLGIKFENFLPIKIYLNYLNFLFILIILIYSCKILKSLKLNKLYIYFISLILITLSPSILFFENLPLYAHFTCMLLFLIKYYFIKVYEIYKIKYELLIYLFSTLLILSWSAYIIYFNILILILLIPLIIKKKIVLRSILIFIFFFVLGSLPSIKNKILFDFFANSSWTGLNAAQSTGYDRQNWPLCSFGKDNLDKHNLFYKNLLKKKNYTDHEMLNDKSYNDLGYIYKSKSCANEAKKFLISNFFEISKHKLQRFLSVHGHLSIDFAFKPSNWKIIFHTLEELNYNNLFKIIVFIFFIANYGIYLFILYHSLKKKQKNHIDYFVIINFMLYSYLLFVSFYGSTWEQERMRYSGYSFIMISTAIIFHKLLTTIKKN